MRYAELTFLVLMVAYHAFLLVPRHRRPFVANYLLFLAGMALAWNLGLEGLRWQTLPPAGLLLVDALVLFPTFSTLRGRMPKRGFFRSVGRGLRSLFATVGLVFAVAGALLAVFFPLPSVELTGGLPPAERIVRFPAEASQPGLEVRLWYPAGGDARPSPRPLAEADTWQRSHLAGGLPSFWQSYQQYLPTNLIRGGKPASPGTRYPVVLVALPPGQSADDFGYLFEDLASRGFLVVAGGPPPGPLSAETFDWSRTAEQILEPLVRPELWWKAEELARPGPATDYHWLAPTVRAVKQLDSTPGDALFGAVDWNRQALWVWGPGNLPSPAETSRLTLSGVIQSGGKAPATKPGAAAELWIGSARETTAQPGRWVLSLPRLERADLSDSAYLKPYLVFPGLKSQPDSGVHGALRQYQAAFLQFAFWGAGSGTSFRQTVPEVQGLLLTGP